MDISWTDEKRCDPLYFCDLAVNEAFKIQSHRSKGAVYIKVRTSEYMGMLDEDGRSIEFAMLEIASGTLFQPTKSKIEPVSVHIEIESEKPSIY